MKIKIGFMAILTFLSLIVTHPSDFCAILLSAALHESGHIFAAKMCGVHFRELTLTPMGALLVPNGTVGSYLDEIFIAAAGPAVNMLSVLCLCSLFHFNRFFALFLASSLFLGLLNLLPVTGFDGGRILFCLLSKKGHTLCAERVLTLSSFFILFVLWAFSLYLLLRVASSLSLFVFSCSLFFRLFICEAPK